MTKEEQQVLLAKCYVAISEVDAELYLWLDSLVRWHPANFEVR